MLKVDRDGVDELCLVTIFTNVARFPVMLAPTTGLDLK
jgi:hypothetical protein